MSNLTLHPLWHTVMPTYQSFVGATTLALSTLAIYLIATKIHHSAKPFVKYLIILQVLLHKRPSINKNRITRCP